MNLLGGVFLLQILTANPSFAYLPEALNYILRSIEFESAVHSGVFHCVFYSVAHEPGAIWSAILQSPRLDHVVKYVVIGDYRRDRQSLPRSPQMLLLDPGSNLTHVMRYNTTMNIRSTVQLFNPTTKVLVLVDSNSALWEQVQQTIMSIGFCRVIYLDVLTL